LICHVQLQRDGIRPNLFGRSFAALQVARPHQHSKAMRHEILCDLRADPLIGPGDQGYPFVLHVIHLQECAAAPLLFWSRPEHCSIY
jgi:hypothetical protein